MTSSVQINGKQSENLVHVLTASGAVAGLVALQNIIAGNVRTALIWLIICQVLDGVDGPLARKYRIDQNQGTFDGRVLDLVVDYVTCAVVPAVLFIHVNLVRQSLSVAVAGVILLTSALWFAKTNQESVDHWFSGFPASWNIVIPSMVILHARESIVFLLVGFFCLLQMSNVKFPHVMKVVAMRRMTLLFTAVYFGCFVLLSVDYPNGPNWARRVLLVAPIYLALLITWRTWRPTQKVLGRTILVDRNQQKSLP